MNYCLPNNAGSCFRAKQEELIYRSCSHSPPPAGGENRGGKEEEGGKKG
jgi:hypothetical protein